MSMKGKQFYNMKDLLGHLADGGEVVEILRGDIPQVKVLTGEVVPRVDFMSYEYFERLTYEGPFGDIVWDRATGKYAFKPTAVGKYVQREEYERLAKEDD
jgi:hypothetical protein